LADILLDKLLYFAWRLNMPKQKCHDNNLKEVHLSFFACRLCRNLIYRRFVFASHSIKNAHFRFQQPATAVHLNFSLFHRLFSQFQTIHSPFLTADPGN
jgi:hypothetical protein